MQITGTTGAASAYYLMDFNSDHTLVWNVNCMTNGIGQYLPSSCESNPTLVTAAFNENNNSTGLIHEIIPFTNANFGGYVVSGTIYETEVCLASGACKIVIVYSGESIS